ncbi:metallopeptidase family protein [Brevundimonas sp. 2R-24]|uniref:Metallopeptidase family protein n=1 Tax=Peiella sedimenti TaxID=3061083 RepID=A0ABT8SKN9_9CAUL|nr:metallopeptidase family protein [Caulobacteraceae bacterium XZ-24]
MNLYGREPSNDDLAQLAREAFERLPEPFRLAVGAVAIRVTDFAEPEVLADLGMDDPWDLSGLYSGVDLTRRSILDPLPEPSEIFLYRRPILAEWAGRGDIGLGRLVEHVLIHEIGHHFGLSDDDIHAIEDGRR